MRTVAWLNKKYMTLHPATSEPFADDVRAELMPLCDQDAAEAMIYARGAALKEALTEIEALKAQLAKFTPLRACGVVDADDNLDCWDTAPFELCVRHVAALNEKDPAAGWRVVHLYAVDVDKLWDEVMADPSTDDPHQEFARSLERRHAIGA